MRSIEHAVIAAAGMGLRMEKNMPKCLIKLEGKPLICHLLENLKNIKDIRIIVGFMAEDVIATVRKYRNDVVFIMNNDYKNTTTLHSYVLGGKYLKSGVLYMDADIYFPLDSFSSFLDSVENNLQSPLVGVTAVKTEDCVYAELDPHNQVISFSRQIKQPWEWANIVYLPHGYIKDNAHAVFQELETFLPLPVKVIESYEMDTPEDLKNTRQAIRAKSSIVAG